jgi:uncharacterized protein YndB with AHSA1/START domain
MTSELRVSRSGAREIHAERFFDASRERVWQAFTDPKLIPQWWGQRSTTTIVETMEVRPGGRWRFVQRSDDGTETGFSGEFRELNEPESLTWTFSWDGNPGQASVETVTFTEEHGGTLVKSVAVFESEKDRDDMLDYGMEAGMAETYDRLDELLAKVSAS